MKICMMSSTMGDASPEKVVAAAVGCGMDAVDWITSAEEIDAEYIGRITRDAGMEVAAYTPVKTEALLTSDEFKRLVADAVKMGSPVMMIPPFCLDDKLPAAENRKLWTQWYADALPIAQQAGIALTLEATGMLTSPITTAQEILEVLHSVPGLKLTHDYGNMITAGTSFEECRELYPYVVHMHMKDWEFFDDEQPFSHPVRSGKFVKHTAIGDGDIDWNAIWNDLDDRIRNLYVNLEIFYPGRNVPIVPVLKRVSEKLRNW